MALELNDKTIQQLLIMAAATGGNEYFERQEILGEVSLRLEADARALWAYRVIERATLIAGSYSGDLARHEALLHEKAEALVAADPSLGEGL